MKIITALIEAIEAAARRHDEAVQQARDAALIRQAADEVKRLLRELKKQLEEAGLPGNIITAVLKCYNLLVVQPATTSNMAARIREVCTLVENAVKEINDWATSSDLDRMTFFRQPVNTSPAMSVLSVGSAEYILLTALDKCRTLSLEIATIPPRRVPGFPLEDIFADVFGVADGHGKQIIEVRTATAIADADPLDTPEELLVVKKNHGLFHFQERWHMFPSATTRLHDLREEAMIFASLLWNQVKHERRRLDEAGPNGFDYDPEMLGSIAFRLTLLITMAVISCAELRQHLA